MSDDPATTAASPRQAEPSSASTDDHPFVAAHNQVRASVSPAPDAPLPPMAWSPELAATAQAWAQRCRFDHSETDYGENLAARTDEGTPADVVASWADEVHDYDYRKNRCANGAVCGHYTQVVWRDSTQVGCGAARCETNSPFGGGVWWLYVCNYAPAGNYMGERPY